MLIKLTLPWLTTGIRKRVGRKLPRVTEEAEHIRTSRDACVSMGKLKKKKKLLTSNSRAELSSAGVLCSSCGFLFLREYFVWILFNIPTPFNKRRASLVKCVLGLLVWHSLHVVVEGSQRCYLVSNLSTSIKYLSSPRPSRKGNLLFQCEGSEQDSKTYRISQLANCTSTQSQPTTKKRTVPCRQYPRSQQSSSTALSYREMRRT